MALLKDHVPALKYGAKIQASSVLGIHTTGNVYYVIKETESFYDQFVSDYHTVYSDGSDSICPDVGATTGTAATALLNTGIQDGLDKCVSSRGDYVVVLPSADDYDIGAALTLSKRNVHLVCPLGMNYGVGASNACKINQIGAGVSLMTISNQNIEVAGLYLKPITTYPAIDFALGTAAGYAWGLNIHHNTIWWYGTTTQVMGSIGLDGDGGSYSLIEYNYFIPAGSSTTTTHVVYVDNSAAFARINNNVCINANSNTLSNVFYCLSQGAAISDNIVGDGKSTITRAITCDFGTVTGNMLAVAATADVAPSGNTNGAVGNWSGAAGGAAASQAS